MKRSFVIYSILFASIVVDKSYCQTSKADYVDTKIGVYDNRESNCVIGPQVPFGSINPSPQTPDGGHDGYHPERPIRGFGQLHVSGTGYGKYGQFLISPQVGIAVGEEQHDSPKSGEITKAYYYKSRLDRYNITAEIAPSHYSAIYRFTFPKTDSAFILMDVTHTLTIDIAKEVGGKVYNNEVFYDSISNSLRGMGTFSGGFGEGIYKLYFVAALNKRPASYGIWSGRDIQVGETNAKGSNGERIGGFLQFKTEQNDQIILKVAVSFKSYDNATKFLESEIKDWDFQSVTDKAKSLWDSQLSKIEIDETSEQKKRFFYSSMYHTMIMPRDRSLDSPYGDGGKYWDDQYATWDTWRTLFPLHVLTNPKVVSDNINSYITRFRYNKEVKDAFVAGGDMFAEQGGNNVDNVITDAFIKNVEGVNWDEAYSILKHDAEYERNGWQTFIRDNTYDSSAGIYKTLGWIPSGIMSCSYTMEYAYNDYCVAQIAKRLGKTDDYQKYFSRSKNWEKLWNPIAEYANFKGFIVPRKLDGSFVDIDLAKPGGSWNSPFYEANSWTYSYFVPHNMGRVIQLMGGNKRFVERLNYALKNKLIVLHNEPSFLAVRSFNMAGRPDLTSYWVNHIMTTLFDSTGYPENDDSGAMSSWFIFSSLGFFPNAGQDIYYLNAPFYSKAVVSLENGKKITVLAKNLSKDNIYIKSCKINNKKWDKPYCFHKDIIEGATIEFELTSKPGKWGQSEEIH